MKRVTKKFFMSLLMAILISVHGLVPVDASIEEDSIRYENKAEFVCGIFNDQDQTTLRHDMEITFFNNNDFPVMLNNLVSLDVQPGMDRPELNQRYLNVLLSPNRGYAIDCQYMTHLFFNESSVEKTEAKNFIGNIYSKNMDVLEIALNYKISPVQNWYPLEGNRE